MTHNDIRHFKVLQMQNSNNNNDNRIERRNSRFSTISSLRRELSPTRTLKGAIICKSRATHRALFTCNVSRASWYEGTAELLRLTDSRLFRLYFYWLRRLTDEEHPDIRIKVHAGVALVALENGRSGITPCFTRSSLASVLGPGTLAASLSGARRYQVVRTGWSGGSLLCLGEFASSSSSAFPS